jgi:hypothetical protein
MKVVAFSKRKPEEDLGEVPTTWSEKKKERKLHKRLPSREQAHRGTTSRIGFKPPAPITRGQSSTS